VITGPTAQEWPANILPAIKRQADAAEASNFLSIMERLRHGLRDLVGIGEAARQQLAAPEPMNDNQARGHDELREQVRAGEQAGELLALCDEWSPSEGPAMLPVDDVRRIFGLAER